MTHITPIVMNTEDLDAKYLANQPEGKRQEKPTGFSLAPNFFLLTQTTGA